MISSRGLRRSWFLVCGVFVGVSLPAQGDDVLQRVGAAIAPAIQGTVHVDKAMAAPSSEVLARIALLVPGGSLEEAKVAAARHAWPEDDDAEARLVLVPVGGKVASQLALVASIDGQIRGAAALDADGKLVVAAAGFLAQLVGHNVPTLDGVVARAEAQKRIAGIEKGTDAASKGLAALLDLRRQMVRQSVAAGIVMGMLERGEAPPEEQVMAMRVAYQAMQERAGAVSAQLGDGAAKYDKAIATVLAQLDAVGKAGDAKQRQAVHKQLKGGCRDCHELSSDKFESNFEEWAMNERASHGLGGRSFLVGYDIMAAGLGEADAQALADACGRAALLVEACRQ